MPSWGQILNELTGNPGPNGMPAFDDVRRKYLAALSQHTGRPTILYATCWLDRTSPSTSMQLGDMRGLMEVCMGQPNEGVDIVLHSPGGDPNACAAIVRYLRSKFSEMRVFVPLAAMSAATMWALGSDRVVMGKHSQLGPIDPQIVFGTGAQMPARAILRQFEQARDECSADPTKLGAWAPILGQYGPALLQICTDAEQLSKNLVAEWLEAFMLADTDDPKAAAAKVADYFANYDLHRSHGLGIDRDHARAVGVRIDDLEEDPVLQDLVLSVHHAAMHTFAGTTCLKIIENQNGSAYVEVGAQQIQVMPGPPPGAGFVPAAPPTL